MRINVDAPFIKYNYLVLTRGKKAPGVFFYAMISDMVIITSIGDTFNAVIG